MMKHWTILLGIATAIACGDSVSSDNLESSAPGKPSVAILGTGDMGDSFGPRLAELGYRVIYGTRSPGSERVQALVERTGNGASAMTSPQAADEADMILLAVAATAVEPVIRSLGDIDGKIIIDMTWPPSAFGDDGYEQISTLTSGGELIQEMLPNARVVKAFGTTGSHAVDNPDLAGGPISIPIASDHREAKETVAAIAAELGFDPVDAGPLRHARYIEAMMALYLVPHFQGRGEGWEFYFRRSNAWQCMPYEGAEFDDEESVPLVDGDNLAEMPQTHPDPSPCPD